MSSPITELLLADAVAADADLSLFAPFVGCWDFDGVDIAPDGTRTEYRGRWDFGYVLGGRAIQDVLYVEGLEHGTTIRSPRGDGTWDVVWITPVNRRVAHLHARPDGDRVLITGGSGEHRRRWTFNDITPQTFAWRGEHSTDGGQTFRLAEDLRLTRR